MWHARTWGFFCCGCSASDFNSASLRKYCLFLPAIDSFCGLKTWEKKVIRHCIMSSKRKQQRPEAKGSKDTAVCVLPVRSDGPETAISISQLMALPFELPLSSSADQKMCKNEHKTVKRMKAEPGFGPSFCYWQPPHENVIAGCPCLERSGKNCPLLFRASRHINATSKIASSLFLLLMLRLSLEKQPKWSPLMPLFS